MTQLRLPIAELTAPPTDAAGNLVRAECASIPRPCTRYLCRHNLAVDDERAGRPHDGVSPPTKVTARTPSCALDVVDEKQGEGMKLHDVGNLLGITRQRAEQLVDRATRKMASHSVVYDALEAVRPRLPKGTTLHLVPPVTSEAHHVIITVILRVEDDKCKPAHRPSSRIRASNARNDE